MEKYDLTVIGAGPGGYEAALEAAKFGMKVAVIEERALGGTCLNRGCIPTKILLHASEVYSEILRCKKLGITVENVGFDMETMLNRKNEVVQTLRSGIEGAFKRAKIDLFSGKGNIVDANMVKVVTTDILINTGTILIATGSAPFIPNIEGIKLSGVMTSDEILDYTDKIASLTIIGGGVIGIEFAQIYNALGAEVTIIEAMERILPSLDREISQSVSMSFKKRGINIVTGVKVEKISGESPSGLTVSFDGNNAVAGTITSEKVLVAIGRRANLNGLFDGGLIETECSQIKIDENCRTNIENIYAIGDCTLNAIQLAHFATAQGLNAVYHITGKPVPHDLSLIPSCIYTTPEIACVGMTQEGAKSAGIEIQTAKYLMGMNGKTQIKTDERGFVKLIVRASDGVLLGAQLLCCHATDMIGELALAIANKLTAKQIASVVHPHPTFGEAVCEAAKMIHGETPMR